jgi:predicted enzyme related to lactoylglutathione lyase
MIAAVSHPEPFGMATIANDLEAARAFYTTLYPYAVSEGLFAGIRYLSIVKDGVTLVNVFQRSAENPITGTIPILKVDSVAECIQLLQSLGGNVIIPESTCPCTMTSFALCADLEGNQFIIKEPTTRTQK